MDNPVDFDLIEPTQLKHLCRFCLNNTTGMKKVTIEDMLCSKIPKLFEIITSKKVYQIINFT